MNFLDNVIYLRKKLHQYPEVAWQESLTSQIILDFSKDYSPDEILKDLGGHGMAFIYKGEKPGRNILIRCELDALPLSEENNIQYRSKIEGKAHLCGHDGHMAIVCGLMPVFHQNRPYKGDIILLFQPSEETGEGAQAVLKDKRLGSLDIDLVFALHNLPSFEKGSIIIRDNEFASASTGLILDLKGKTSHAAEPEKGINPSMAISEIIPVILRLPEWTEELSISAIVGIMAGSRAFGTSAGDGRIMSTIRSYRNEDMEFLLKKAVSDSHKICENYNLKMTYDFVEKFPATQNDSQCNEIIEKSALKNGFKINKIEKPFRWSEDFALWTDSHKGALFGLGSGIDQPALHNPDYNFPDDIIKTGIEIFYTITKEAQK